MNMSNSILLIIALVCFLLIIFLVFFYLAIQRFLQLRRERFIRTYQQATLDQWYSFLVADGPVVELTFSKKQQQSIFLAVDQIFSNYVTTTNNPQVKQCIKQFSQKNFQSHYKNMLYKRDWAQRLNALYRILNYGLDFLYDDVRQLLNEKKYKNFEDYSLMLKIISIYDQPLFLQHLDTPDVSFSEFEYKHIIFSLPATYFDIFIAHFDDLPFNLQLAVLEYFGYYPASDETVLHFFEKQLSSVIPEIRIRSLKAIYKFGLLTTISHYESFMTSEIWEERYMFTKILELTNLTYASKQLQILIHDSSWWVRKQAAQSLLYVKNGREILYKLTQEGKDPYAMQIAKETLKVL